MDDRAAGQSDKVFKIKYELNLLPCIGFHFIQENKELVPTNEDVSLVGLFSETEELEIFSTEAIQSLISYKWDTFGRKHHFTGFIAQLIYTLVFALYVKEAYLQDD
jgi:hypothetical protein